MYSPSKEDEICLYRMYVFSAVRAMAEHPEAEGITLVRTAAGEEYSFPFPGDPDFTEKTARVLMEGKSAPIRYLIHVWKDHTLDVPSYGLRQAFLKLHPENGNALLMLNGENGFAVLPLGETMR